MTLSLCIFLLVYMVLGAAVLVWWEHRECEREIAARDRLNAVSEEADRTCREWGGS